MIDEEDTYRDMLESKRFDIVQNLQVERTFVFDYLRNKSVLDGEDCELIRSEKTTSLQIGKFVDILSRKGPEAYNCLLESLQLENPTLYKKLTGEEACPTTSPIMTKLKNSYLGVGDPLGNGELEILTKHLERTYGDLHEMSRRFEQVVQRKKSIEEKLETTIHTLERKQETVEHLQQQINSGRRSPENHTNWVKWLQYVETLRKEKSDRDIYIIALQTNLMSTKEELEEVRKKNANLQNKNEELHKVIDEVSADYKKKKCESLRLNERILRQGGEIKKAEQAMRKIREYQFQNMKLREERDTAKEELGELRKWTDALKNSFDIVELEKEKTLSNHSEIIADYGSVQDELMRCKEEMNEVQSVAADLRERMRHLEQDRQAYKKQRDRALAVRRGAVLDRDKAFLERDQAVKKYNELNADREEKIENSIMQLKCYDEIVARNDVMEDEVEQVKIKLREKERELEEMKLKYGLEDNNGIVQRVVEPEGKPECEGEEDTLGCRHVDQCLDNGGDEYASRTTELVTSIKRRVNKARTEVCFISLNCPKESPQVFLRPSLPAFPPAGSSFPDILRETGMCRGKLTRKPIRSREKRDESAADDESLERGIEASTEPNKGPRKFVRSPTGPKIRPSKDIVMLERDIVMEANKEIGTDESSSNGIIINYL